MRRRWAVLSLMLALAAAAAARGLTFEETRLQVGGKIRGVHPMDANGDGNVDLLVLADARLLVFPGLGGGRLATAPALDAPLPAGTVLYDLGDLDSDGDIELVVITAGGADAYDMQLTAGGGGGGLSRWPVSLVQAATIFRGGEVPRPARVSFLQDLRGTGALDIIIPQARLLMVRQNDGRGHFALTDPIKFPEDGSLDVQRAWNRSSGQDPSASFTATVRIPRVIVAEAGGAPDQRDLILLTGDDLEVYRRGADGLLPTTSSNKLHVPDPPAVEGKRAMRLLGLPVLMEDVDGDGLTDMVVPDSGQGRVALHRQSAGTWPEKADDLVTVPGWLVGAQLDDLNGDKRADLILVRIDEVDLWGALSIITSKTLPVEISVYLAEGGTFLSRPAFRQSADIPLRFGGDSPGTVSVEAGFIPTAAGDYDGDGVTDMVLLSGKDTLRIVGSAGAPGGAEWQEIARVKVAGMSEYRTAQALAADLDSSGAADLILVGRAWDDGGKDELRVFLRK